MNLNELQAPQIIEELSVEEILLRLKEELVAIDSEYTAYLGSDPLMEVAAYRELLLRQLYYSYFSDSKEKYQELVVR
jgi:phage-related baseplate assembly protein